MSSLYFLAHLTSVLWEKIKFTAFPHVGFAIDTALAKGEEFPYFTEFWIIEPSKGKPITIYARLESPSVAGAYKFVIFNLISTPALR